MKSNHGKTPNVLSPLDCQFAEFLSQMDGNSDEVKLAAALVSHYRSLGHSCLDFNDPGVPGTAMAASPQIGVTTVPGLPAWLNRLRHSSVVGKPGEFRPLILDSAHRLYLHRYWNYEAELARNIQTRAAESTPISDPTTLRASLESWFGTDKTELNWQAVAAFAAVRGRLCIISGGPGTGKTRTVVVLLTLLLQQSNEGLRIALAAPTGKAAARLQESIKHAHASIQDHSLRARLPTEAGTIHRLLGYRPDSARFSHNAENLLPYDVVVVDEASMVDLALMAKLVEAVAPSARLILLGDKDQLASVEAGAVLADLCDATTPLSPQFVREFRNITGLPLPGEPAAKAPLLADCIVELRRNYRFPATSDIYRLSQTVRQGQSAEVLQLLKQAPAEAEVFSRSLPSPTDLKENLRPLVQQFYAPCFRAPDPIQALQLFGKFRILCAVRSGPYGIEQVNRIVREILMDGGLISPGVGQMFPGRPVMVTRNDYQLKLFNGDIGILFGTEGSVQACFAGPTGERRDILPLRLPEHETAFAMTVHKSQGSEFERILLILPRDDSPVLSRELVYTGITRASRQVELWIDQNILATAVSRKIVRRSGLRDALWGTEA